MTLTEIRITDPYTIAIVSEEMERTGEKAATKVAGRMIAQLAAQREVIEHARREAKLRATEDRHASATA